MESSWKENMTEPEARQLVIESIKAGILNDLGSGSNVDVCNVTLDGYDLKRSEYSTKREDLKVKPFDVGSALVISEEVIWEGKEEPQKMEED